MEILVKYWVEKVLERNIYIVLDRNVRMVLERNTRICHPLRRLVRFFSTNPVSLIWEATRSTFGNVRLSSSPSHRFYNQKYKRFFFRFFNFWTSKKDGKAVFRQNRRSVGNLGNESLDGFQPGKSWIWVSRAGHHCPILVSDFSVQGLSPIGPRSTSIVSHCVARSLRTSPWLLSARFGTSYRRL